MIPLKLEHMLLSTYVYILITRTQYVVNQQSLTVINNTMNTWNNIFNHFIAYSTMKIWHLIWASDLAKIHVDRLLFIHSTANKILNRHSFYIVNTVVYRVINKLSTLFTKKYHVDDLAKSPCVLLIELICEYAKFIIYSHRQIE